MIVVRNNVGRLVEVKIATPITTDEIRAMAGDILAIATDKRRIVGVTDLREANVFPSDLAEQILAFLRRDSEHIERSAFLLAGHARGAGFDTSAVFSLQLERILREAANPSRRAFRSANELVAYLKDCLTTPETERVAAFLAS